jgi:geranylgeranyl diphosphate synthase type I
MNAEEILNRHLPMIDNDIKDTFRGRDFPKPLYDMMRYHMGWLGEDLQPVDQYGGKRFRPTMCLLTYHALSGVYDKALPVASAIELIHNFSLIHDDIEDMDEERRHKPTVWKLWGIPHAINAGDGMHVMANLAALRLEDLNVTDSKIVQVMKILNRAIITLCEGQYLDMSFEDSLDITTDMYMEMIARKTAALIETSTMVGAVLATSDERMIDHFANFGRKIGLAFQIIDDIIGIWETKTGKPKASDIRNKKKTLPVLYAFEKASEEKKKLLHEKYQKETLDDEDINQVMEVLEDVGAHEYCKKVAKKYEDEALQELEKTNLEGSAIQELKTLARFLVKRTY